jgi:hypothetical protein
MIAHFLACFIMLVTARLFQMRLLDRLSIVAIVDTLRRAVSFRLKENRYAMDNCDEAILCLRNEMYLDPSQCHCRHRKTKGMLTAARCNEQRHRLHAAISFLTHIIVSVDMS